MTGILMWDKPKRAKPIEEWRNDNGFEDGPAGGYVPNMSSEDAQRWKAKLTGVRRGHPQVEIRKTIGSASLLLIVSLGDGYVYKGYGPTVDHKTCWYPTTGVNVHLSINGAAQFTFDVFEEMNAVVIEAKAFLEKRLADED